MKTVLFMRHAKSSWDKPNQDDFERSLNDRGKKDAPEMAKRIVKQGFKPDSIICSPATRTFKTAKLVSEVIGFDTKHIRQEMDLYEARIEDIMYLIRQLPEAEKNVLIIGHNPAFTGIVGYLTHQFIDNLPTAGVALIELNIDTWKQTVNNCGKLTWFDFPKNEM